MDDLLEQNIFDDGFIVFNNDIPYDSYPLENDLCYCCGMSHWVMFVTNAINSKSI